MNLAAASSILIPPTRQRKAFDPAKHVELMDSIQNPSIGLLHPIVLRQDEGSLVLVAGERRLRAFLDSHELGVITYHAGLEVPAGMVPYTDIGALSALDAWEAELEENIRRTDLTWQERADATSKLMELRRAQAEANGGPAPTVADIAEEVRGSGASSYHSTTRKELVLANHLTDPEIAKAKTLDEGVKILRRREEKTRNIQIAASVGRLSSSTRHQAHHADAEEWVKTVPSGSYDIILTDPPYGMGADEFGDSGGRAAGGHDYTDTPDTLKGIMKWFFAESFRITKPAAHLYLFCDIDWFWWIRAGLAEAGWKVFRTPLIWHKPSGFRTPWVDMGPQRRYETILYAAKGDKRIVKLGGDVLSFPSDDNLGHMAQKPVALYTELLSRSAIPGSRVLDLFAGSGPLIPAAESLHCLATCVEKDPAAYGLIVSRLKELK